jgi:hypothetical protein
MTAEPDPLDLAKQDARAFVDRQKDRAVDFGKKFLTASLVKLTFSSAVVVGLAAKALPVVAVVGCAVVIAALLVYAIYATRMLKRKDAELRHAWIANYRLRQRHLEHQIATDNVTLTLMGERQGSVNPYRSVPPELRSALAMLMHRVRDAEARADAAEAAKEGSATDAQRRALAAHRRGREPAPPKGPAVEPIRKRKEAREAERAALEAEIQALALPGDVERAMAAEKAKRTQHERQDAAMKADQVARDRARRGLSPTAEEPEHTIRLGMKVNGDADVRQGRGEPTPEQVARGDSG